MTGNGKARRASRAEREADRRRAILRAAVEVFSKKGFHGCRIADVAREAKVAYGLVYHYFKDKDELLESVFASGWMGFVGRLKEAIGSGGSFEARIRAVIRLAFDAYRHDPRGVKVLILEVGRSPAGGSVNRGKAFMEVLSLAASLFREGQASGEVDRAAEPMVCAAMLFGAIEMGLTVFILGLLDRRDDVLLQRASEQVAESFLRGVLSAPLPAEESQPWMNERSATRSKAARRA